MVFTFYKARGLGVGSSLVEEDQLELAKKLETMAKEKGVEVRLQGMLCPRGFCGGFEGPVLCEGVLRVWAHSTRRAAPLWRL